jgi:glycosyltransferase involved in cell wall biosynthesis
MLLIIQIPCYNEESCIAQTLSHLPKSIPGFDSLEILIINDGSTDHTMEIARQNGVRHILDLKHVGLAQAFQAGLKESCRMGADIVVNLDADNQYNAQDIGAVVKPLVLGTHQVAIGERDLQNLPYFSKSKRFLHHIGNKFIRLLSGLPVNDATSGFRALHKDVAQEIAIRSSYTYTVEMLFYISYNKIRTAFIPIRCNDKVLRPSRLIRSNTEYIVRTSMIILRSLIRYKPIYFYGIFLILLFLIICAL